MDKGINIVKMGYSVSIKNDYRNIKKINSYIPTEKSMKLLDKFLYGITNQNNGSYLLSGAYGSGKSYFSSLLLNLLVNEDINSLNILKKRAEEKYPFENILNKLHNKKYLVVFAEDRYDTFLMAINMGILDCIKRNNLNIVLNSDYQVILEKFKSWEVQYPEILSRFSIELKKHNISIEEFKKDISNYNRSSLTLFSEIYEKVFYGEKFVNFNIKNNISELLQEFEEKIKQEYSGVIYVFDEFGRYLESNINDIDVKEIQDMAEYCNDKNNSFLLMITHKDIFQYTNKLNKKDNVFEWEKVSGRFQKEYLFYEKTTSLDILAEGILKDDHFNTYKNDHKSLFNSYFENLKDSGLLTSDIEETATKFYPLNYISAFMLPDLSQKIAQNERTMFAFLSSDEEKSLKNIYNNEFIVGLDKLYDYFEENFKFMNPDSNEYKSYLHTKNILNKQLTANEVKFIKTLALMYIYNKFTDIEPTKINLMLALNLTDKEFNKVVKNLQDRNYITYKRNFNHYKIVEDTDINVELEIKEYIENKLKNINFTDIMNKYLKINTFYPLIYNSENDITRYLKCYYLDTSNAEQINILLNKDYSDGTIIYLTNIEGNDKYQLLKDILLEKNIIVVANKNGSQTKIDYMLKEIAAIECLIVSENKYRDGIIKKELELYMAELIKMIENEINYYFSIKNRVLLYNHSEKRKINLLDASKEYLEALYPKFIPLNYELINKNDLSVPMKKVRENLINMIINEDSQLTNDNFYENTGAINSVARILLVNAKFYEGGKINFNSHYEKIHNEIYSSIKENNQNISTIYENYCTSKNGYGLRKGVFSFILAFIIIKNKNIFSVISNDEKRKINFTGNLINAIEKHPEKYSIIYTETTEEQKQYIESLKELLKIYISDEFQDEEAILNGMRTYFYSLPRVASKEFLEKTTVLYKILGNVFQDKNPYDFVFKELLVRCKTSNLSEVLTLIKNDIRHLELQLLEYETKIKEIVNLALRNQADALLKDSLESWKNSSEITNNGFETWLQKYNFISEKKFLLDITSKIKGFSFENWISINEISDFEEKLNSKLINKNEINPLKDDIIEIKSGDEIKKIKLLKENSQMGKMLKIKLQSTIKSMGLTVNEDEKRSILLEIINSI